MQIAILGRQPKISLAELESLFGANNITPILPYAAIVDKPNHLPQEKLGGTIKSAKIIDEIPTTKLEEVFLHIQNVIDPYINKKIPDGKIQLGISLYGMDVSRGWVLKQSLIIKKLLRKSNRSVRIVENRTGSSLDAAQILYNKLTGPQGVEILIIRNKTKTIIAQTTSVQDIDSYASRDHGRPNRDAFVGMLPPKLAQIMINLGVSGLHEENDEQSPQYTIMDPFCGTGVVLQEALLLGHSAYGSDISRRMVEYSNGNIDWLSSALPEHTLPMKYIEIGDATKHTWDFSRFQNCKPVVVCEVYLGEPLTSLPPPEELRNITNEVNSITLKFLKNISVQVEKGTRMCIALPAWRKTSKDFVHLNLLDHLSDIGYNRLDLIHASRKDLIYYREDQVVAREITILEKI